MGRLQFFFFLRVLRCWLSRGGLVQYGVCDTRARAHFSRCCLGAPCQSVPEHCFLLGPRVGLSGFRGRVLGIVYVGVLGRWHVDGLFIGKQMDTRFRVFLIDD